MFVKFKMFKIVYFCMEYGLYILMCFYLGGFGVLVGDYFKEVSDFNIDMVVVGLLYCYGYF